VLTGESEPVSKITTPLMGENIPLGDQKNRLFMGTVITFGRGVAVITETGMQTQLGRIADLIQTVGVELTPLQRRLDKLGKSLAIVALGIVAVVFTLGLLRGEDIRVMFQTAISMAVAAIPEGLVAVVTIALALGAQRMLQRRALIRKLPAVETLGSVTVICSDKTGTLTENRMTVTVADVANHTLDLQERVHEYSPRISSEEVNHPVVIDYPAIAMLLTGAALCNDAVLEANTAQGEGFSAVGDPTEGALVVAAARAGLWKDKLERGLPRVSELPFDSQRKRMTTVHQMQPDRFPTVLKHIFDQHPRDRMEDYLTITKGSVDGMLAISNRVWDNGRVEPMDDAWRERISSANDRLAQNGMRVLGVGFRMRGNSEVDDAANPLESDLVFVGRVAMIHPARQAAEAAGRIANSAGGR
jgi:Ca2+-transporting ATPase